MSHNPAIPPALTFAEAHQRAAALLAEGAIETPKRDARVLLCEAADIDHAALLRDPDARLGDDAAARLQAFVERRLEREPVSRILGRREFWGLTLRVTPDVLDPRADTETLVAAAVETLRDRRGEPLRILDLGTGSGALLCALLSEFPHAFGIGIDRSEPACRIARENLIRCGLAGRGAIICGHWGAALAGGFDLVVANPPYIASGAIGTLAPEVRDHDPRPALDGGPDGLAAYRAIATGLGRLSAPHGVAVLEIGHDQAESAPACFRQAGWAISLKRDLENQPRALILRR
ncbi:MAG: release factor glutamine methyltransferase [Methylobacteriaceae bacterium]|nr:release factor glutamine methyltransferase [Methylobacteriaceae bacterium]